MVIPCGIYGEQTTLTFPLKYLGFIVIPQTPHNHPLLHITFKRVKILRRMETLKKGSHFSNSGASRKGNTFADLFSTLKGEIRMCYSSSSTLMVNV